MRRTKLPVRPLRAALGVALTIAMLGLPVSAAAAEPLGRGAFGAVDRAAEWSILLADEDDFVSQYTEFWCIGASMQMMLGIAGVTDDESRAAQESYMRLARSTGRPISEIDHGDADSADQLQGAGSLGWARGLQQLGAGPYGEVAVADYDTAIRTAASALQTTRRPIGLIVWRGAHAWVMTGFTATSDPAINRDARITGVYVLDSWYPRVSSIWGRGQEPNTWVSVEALTEDFLPRRGGRGHAEMAGKFVLVLPSPLPRADRFGLRAL